MRAQVTRATVLAAGLVLAFGGAAQAATITGVTIEDVSSELTEGAFDRRGVHTVDGVGLSGAQHGTGPETMWLTKGTYKTPNDPLPAHITYDLASNYDLDSFHVWNYNEAGNFAKRGANDVTISVASSEGGAFTSLGNFSFTKAPGAGGYTGETIDLSAYAAANDTRLIRFDITSNHGGDNSFAGLSEVQFDGTFAGPGIFVPNFSFQQPVMNPGGNAAPITDWTTTGSGGGVYFPNGADGLGNPLPAPALGSQYAYLEAPGNGAQTAITTTNPVATVAADTTYTLTAAIGHRNKGDRRPDDYLIELLVNGVPMASNQLSNAYATMPANTFQDLSASFTSPSSGGTVGGALTIRLTHSSDDGTFRQGAFDNVRLAAETTAVIPEPVTMAMTAMALAGLGGYVRKRRNTVKHLTILLAAIVLFAGAQWAEAGIIDLNGLNALSTGDYSFTADSQTFDAYVHNDGGTGWLLVGRGRNGWEFDTNGQGAVASVNQNLGTPAAFAPAMYSDAIVNDLITNSGVDLTDVEIRIRRAGDSAGVNPYQEARWRPLTQTTWTGDFDAGSGYAVRHEILSGIGGHAGPVNTNTRDAIHAGNNFSRIFTWAWGGHDNQQGFSYGNVTTDGANNATSFWWENGSENHALPYTEVYIRSINAGLPTYGPNLVTDGSFEVNTNSTPGGTANSELGAGTYAGSSAGQADVTTHWDKSGLRTWYVTDGGADRFPDGDFAYRVDASWHDGVDWLWQDGIPLTAGTEYQLSFEMWGEASGGDQLPKIDVTLSGPDTLVLLDESYSVGSDGVTEKKMVRFTPTVTGAYRLSFSADNPARPHHHAWIDDVRIRAVQTAVIPEPITVTMAALALCGLGGYVRRRRA